jgi:hypothetical protein
MAAHAPEGLQQRLHHRLVHRFVVDAQDVHLPLRPLAVTAWPTAPQLPRDIASRVVTPRVALLGAGGCEVDSLGFKLRWTEFRFGEGARGHGLPRWWSALGQG